MSHDDQHDGRPTGREQDYSNDPTMNVTPESDPTTPFRVEPAVPVPDDAVNPDAATPDVADPDAAQTQTPPPPQWAPPVAPPPWTQPASSVPQQSPALVTVRTGPRPGTVALGLLSLVVAALVLVRNLTGAQLDLVVAGPIIVAAIGGLLLVVGLVGVAVGRRHHN